MDGAEQSARTALEHRIRTILPATYQDCYEDVQPVSMGSAGLKYGADGKVAWNEIWATFCDLAMAGGPPHKGKLLEPGTAAEIAAAPERYAEVVAEICRGVRLVTELNAEAAPEAGWVRVTCADEAMAGWLLRAIVMENVAARQEDLFLDLPAGPGYRIEKEIKNVITVIAKTCHYWVGHMWPAQERAIGAMFAEMAETMPLIAPGGGGGAEWKGLECGEVGRAIWMMRALVASNVLARREGTVLFVPVHAAEERVAQIRRLAPGV